jgi:glycosyltransferase involved in cell wall biosynthesis
MIYYSIIIPVFRGTETLFNLYDDLLDTFGTTSEFEVILVFDCGLESSLHYCQTLAIDNCNVSCIKLSRNFGQHNAIIAGILKARGQWIITMDEDLQHSASDIPKLIHQQKNTGASVVYADYHERNHNFFRNATSAMMKKLLRLGIPDLYPHYSPFRLIKSDIALHLLKMNNSYTFLDGYLSWITNNFSHVNIKHLQSQSGQSSYTIKKLIAHSINIFITFSSLPIRLLSIMSVIFFTLSTLYASWIIFNTFAFNNYQAGFPTLVVMLGFGFGGVLLGLATLGEYLHRINLKATNRPNYIIEKITTNNDAI